MQPRKFLTVKNKLRNCVNYSHLTYSMQNKILTFFLRLSYGYYFSDSIGPVFETQAPRERQVYSLARPTGPVILDDQPERPLTNPSLEDCLHARSKSIMEIFKGTFGV